MITEVKTYFCVPSKDERYRIPTDDDLIACSNIAKKDNLLAELKWLGPDNVYYGGIHSVYIMPTDTIDDIKNKMPKVYGL